MLDDPAVDSAGSMSGAADVVTTLNEWQSLSPAEAAGGLQARVRVTATYAYPEWGMLFAMGEGVGTYFTIPVDTIPLRPGDEALVMGTTSHARGYAEVLVDRVEPTGVRRELAPQRVSVSDIRDGRSSGHWVQFEGRVLACYPAFGRTVARLKIDDDVIEVSLLNCPVELAERLVNARVRMTGVASIHYSDGAPTDSVVLLVQEPEQVDILESAEISPLESPVTPIEEVYLAVQRRDPPSVHVQGWLVGKSHGGAVRVQDATGSIRVCCLYEPDAQLESLVDVYGTPAVTNGEVVIRHASVAPAAATADIAHSEPEVHAEGVDLPVMETAAAVHGLSRSEAARGHPVRLEGVVTYVDIAWNVAFFQDDTDAVFVAPIPNHPPLQSGQRVRVEGFTVSGDFAPAVSGAHLTVLGEGTLPPPRRVSVTDLMTGHFDCQWVVAEGVVRSADHQNGRSNLYVQSSTGRFLAPLSPVFTQEDVQRLLGARVSVRGAVGGEFNSRGQLISVRLYVPDPGAVWILEPPPDDPFTVPFRSIVDLLRYQPGLDQSDRIKVAGIVTSVMPHGAITLQDNEGGMMVELMHFDALPSVGDTAEVVGFPYRNHLDMSLSDARLKILGAGPDATPVDVTAEEILRGDYGWILVRVNARLLENGSLRSGRGLVLQSGSVVFEAHAASSLSAGDQRNLLAGSLVEVSGVCRVKAGTWGPVRSFGLLTRDSYDLRVLQHPPWWNHRRLLWVALGTAAAGAFALAWGMMTNAKNRLLSQEMLQRELAETELQRAHDALREVNRSLESAKRAAEAGSEAKSRFLAMMSHEIRTPLNGVTGMLHLLQEDRLTPRQRRWLDMAQTSAKTLLRIINDVLDFSKVEAGKLDLEMHDFDLSAAVRATAAPMARKASDRGLAWRLDLDPDLPGWVRGDLGRVVQVLGNLLSNAVKFTESGRVGLNVRKVAEAEGTTRVRFEVADSGIGIDPAKQTDLFVPFTQVDSSASRRYGGTGLGLSICRNLVDLMRGEIGAESRPGEGSTFWFEIPLAVVPGREATESVRRREAPTPESPPPMESVRVLLAEDHEINQELAVEMIRACGAHCDCVANGRLAVEAATHNGHYDLIFMDCMMPKMDGYEATRSIRREEERKARSGIPPRRIPIIAMTANAMKGDREKCLDAGMDDYLSKPIDPEDLPHMIRKWIQG